MMDPRQDRTICRLDALAEGETRGFTIERTEGRQEIFLLRRGGGVVAYVNSCPHRGSPLDWVPDRFLSADGRHFLCATHGALFRIEDGVCIAGPCVGASLRPVPVEIRDGAVVLASRDS